MLKATCSKRLPPHYFDPFSPLICSRCLGSPINYQNYLAGFRPRATRPFCFGKRAENHSRPCAAPLGKLRHDTKLYGCATRFAQTVLAREVEFGAMAPPRPRRLPHWPVHGFERTRSVFPLLPIIHSTVVPAKVGIQVGIFQRYAGRNPAR